MSNGERSKNRTCSVEGCPSPHDAKGLCQKHYHLQRRYGSTKPRPKHSEKCSKCDKPFHSKGFCRNHYSQWRTANLSPEIRQAEREARSARYKARNDGCYNKEARATYYRKHFQSPHGRFESLLSGAKRRNLPVEIGEELFKTLTAQKCCYCGDFSPGHDFVGLDRIDSGRGYLFDNVVPCCSTCNTMKNVLSRLDFLAHIAKILAYSHTQQGS